MGDPADPTRGPCGVCAPAIEHRDEDGWLAVFEQLGRERLFDHEPDYSKALGFFREALDRARAATDSPFDPPPEFLPNHPTSFLRVEFSRSG